MPDTGGDTGTFATLSTGQLDLDGDGVAASAGDCDDRDPMVHPGAPELCNGQDDDCDGLVDDDDPSLDVASGQAWYWDRDGDGFGSDDEQTLACRAPGAEDAHWVPDGGDCDDGDADTWPGAPEQCDDGRVNDCGGSEEAALARCPWPTELRLSEADTVFEESGEDFATWSAATGDLDGDGLEDIVFGSSWSGGGYSDGRVYALAAPFSTGITTLTRGYAIRGADHEYLGADPSLDDVDGDGYADLLVGAPHHSGGATQGGAAYLVYGPLTNGAALDLASLVVQGRVESGNVGSTLAVVGDQDGDGASDLLVAGYRASLDGHAQAFVISSSKAGTVEPAGEALATISGPGFSESFGTQGQQLDGSGDLDGDGITDLVLGAPWSPPAGQVHAFLGVQRGALTLEDADIVLASGYDGPGSLGEAVMSGFDWNGDGADDLAIGNPESNLGGTGAGALYVLEGPLAGQVDPATDAQLVVVGGQRLGRLGSVMDTGQIDGDALPDLLVGSGRAWLGAGGVGLDEGSGAWVVQGGATGTLDAASALVTLQPRGEYSGLCVAVLGDQDGSGTDELLTCTFLQGRQETRWHLFGGPAF